MIEVMDEASVASAGPCVEQVPLRQHILVF